MRQSWPLRYWEYGDVLYLEFCKDATLSWFDEPEVPSHEWAVQDARKAIKVNRALLTRKDYEEIVARVELLCINRCKDIIACPPYKDFLSFVPLWPSTVGITLWSPSRGDRVGGQYTCRASGDKMADFVPAKD